MHLALYIVHTRDRATKPVLPHGRSYATKNHHMRATNNSCILDIVPSTYLLLLVARHFPRSSSVRSVPRTCCLSSCTPGTYVFCRTCTHVLSLHPIRSSTPLPPLAGQPSMRQTQYQLYRALFSCASVTTAPYHNLPINAISPLLSSQLPAHQPGVKTLSGIEERGGNREPPERTHG